MAANFTNRPPDDRRHHRRGQRDAVEDETALDGALIASAHAPHGADQAPAAMRAFLFGLKDRGLHGWNVSACQPSS